MLRVFPTAVGVLTGLLMLSAAGCSGGSNSGPAQLPDARSRAGATTPVPRAVPSASTRGSEAVLEEQPMTAGKNAAPQIDSVATSQLREQSLSLLMNAAAAVAPEQRANAIEGLLVVPVRLEGVLKRTLSDENLGVRAISAMAVGKARMSSLVESVRPLLNDPSPMVQASAIMGITKAGAIADPTPLAGMLHSPDPRVRAQAAFVLGEIGNRSAVGMLKEASLTPAPRADPASMRIFQLQIAEALVKLGEDGAVQEVRAALYPSRPEDFEAAALAAQIIGQVNDRASVSALVYLTAFQDSQKNKYPAEVRLAAAGSLARLGNSRGSFIADEYRDNPLEALRAQAAMVYGETGQSENLPKLRAMLADPDALVRISAAAAVLKITDRGISSRDATAEVGG